MPREEEMGPNPEYRGLSDFSDEELSGYLNTLIKNLSEASESTLKIDPLDDTAILNMRKNICRVLAQYKKRETLQPLVDDHEKNLTERFPTIFDKDSFQVY